MEEYSGQTGMLRTPTLRTGVHIGDGTQGTQSRQLVAGHMSQDYRVSAQHSGSAGGPKAGPASVQLGPKAAE